MRGGTAAAREAVKGRGASGTRKAKRRTRTTTPRRDGLAPTRFAAVLQGLMADGGWDMGLFLRRSCGRQNRLELGPAGADRRPGSRRRVRLSRQGHRSQFLSPSGTSRW